MEDRRIVKTKKSLKAALIKMLNEKDFEHISITELCREAEELLTDIFRSGILTEKEEHEKMEAMGLEPMTSRV